MTTAALVIGGVVAVLCVVFVARPFLREPAARREADRLDEPGPAGERRLALAALKELEFDHRTGKVSDEDYRELLGPLRQAAATALQALDRGNDDRRDIDTVSVPVPPSTKRPSRPRRKGR